MAKATVPGEKPHGATWIQTALRYYTITWLGFYNVP